MSALNADILNLNGWDAVQSAIAGIRLRRR